MDNTSVALLSMIIAVLCFRAGIDFYEAHLQAKEQAREEKERLARAERIKKLTNRM